MQNDVYFDNDQEDIPKTVRRRKKQLYESIRERMEFYFSDSNLQKDRFLSKLIEKNPKVELSIFLRFNRIQQLTNSVHDLKKALEKSEILELNGHKTKVFRKTPIQEKPNVDACTIYVEQLPCDVDHDWLKLIFSRYGKIDYVSIPKYKNSRKIKGFAFIEFDTPESAKAALDEFEKEGCCLTNQMNPEKLCSIATFEGDKFDGKNQLNNKKNEKPQISKVTDENEVKKATKRKHKESEGENESKSEEKKKKKLEVGETKVQVTKEKEESVKGKEKPIKEKEGPMKEKEKPIKEKEEPIKEKEEPISIKEKVEVKEVTIDENESQDESKIKQADGDVPTKKKKNRKKKKSLKIKYVKDIKMYGLQILSKADWKKLRNKYLNLQKEKMKKLKQHLCKSHMSHRQQPVTNQVVEHTKPRFQFSSGLVIKVLFDERVKDRNQVAQFKCDAKTMDKVEYVDVDVGNKEGYIRFRDEFAVQQALRSKLWEHMSVLKGEEEKKYWEKMKQHRSEKFENKKKFKKKRGRNKIIEKAEKLMSKKIRLSVDE